MTELFQKIELPEVLLWAEKQSEELSPNLTKFTEHFNNMSYWVRSIILTQSDAKTREKYMIKFLKVMKVSRSVIILVIITINSLRTTFNVGKQ